MLVVHNTFCSTHVCVGSNPTSDIFLSPDFFFNIYYFNALNVKNIIDSRLSDVLDVKI